MSFIHTMSAVESDGLKKKVVKGGSYKSPHGY